jgi:hypothetical protein
MTIDQVLEFTKILIWPVVVVWLAFLFRLELQKLLQRLSQFKFQDFEAKFSEKLDQSEISVPETVAIAGVKSDKKSDFDLVHSLIDISPRSAVLEAYVLFEQAARKAAQSLGVPESRRTPAMVVGHLAKLANYSNSDILALSNLRDLRNMAAHAPDIAITEEMANDYIALAQKAIRLLENAPRQA